MLTDELGFQNEDFLLLLEVELGFPIEALLLLESNPIKKKFPLQIDLFSTADRLNDSNGKFLFIGFDSRRRRRRSASIGNPNSTLKRRRKSSFWNPSSTASKRRRRIRRKKI